jgi:hypothetical protein
MPEQIRSLIQIKAQVVDMVHIYFHLPGHLLQVVTVVQVVVVLSLVALMKEAEIHIHQ